jgi:hypothetical protein
MNMIFLSTLTQVCAFAREFNLIPTLCDAGDVNLVYSQAFRGHSEEEHVALLGYPEFVELLARLANLIYSKPDMRKQHPTPESRV